MEIKMPTYPDQTAIRLTLGENIVNLFNRRAELRKIRKKIKRGEKP
jgi:hypothetical protein